MLPGVSIAQIDPTVKADETNLPMPSHCGDRADLPMSHKDKLETQSCPRCESRARC
jgi:hypothetical protein